MIETELKIALDPKAHAALKRCPDLAEMRTSPPRTETLVSVYYDTAGHDLAAAGVVLRMRKVGRCWVQTVKRRAGTNSEAGLFSIEELERSAPGGRLVLEGQDQDGALAAVRAAADGAPLAPIFETRVKWVSGMLAAPGGGEVELALDEGEIRAGEASLPLRQAELELKEGQVGAVYAVARRLFRPGQVRFAADNKSARGYRLARGEAEPSVTPRNARTLSFDPEATVETVARDVLRDCLGQIATNMVVVADGTAIEGPHQLRVGLRRLRTALSVFGPVLGKESMAPLGEAAKRLGQVVGRLRDVNVLIDDVLAGAAGHGLDPAAWEALQGALAELREATRAEVRTTLASPEAVGFLFDLGAYIERRGWLVPSDYGQSARLATPVSQIAPERLEKRHRKVRKAAHGLRRLDAEGLHALRKELKKLRYQNRHERQGEGRDELQRERRRHRQMAEGRIKQSDVARRCAAKSDRFLYRGSPVTSAPAGAAD